ncbi:MAG: phage portal protein [Rhodanobacteraceae bacterium]|nr:phage portal protein [Rhodanobacteraceae bacterium]
MPTTDTPNEYQASGSGRRLRAWRPAMSGPNSASNIATMVARMRDASRNNPWVGAAQEKRAINGIGVGIQAKQIWGTKAFRKAVDALWASSMKRMDADGVCTFYGMQELAWREWDEAGEVFARIRSRRPADGLPVPMQVQLIESEQCPRDYHGMASNRNPIRQGIEYNAIGGRVAYWMYRSHPGDATWMDTRANELVRVPAEQVIHLYRPMRAGQQRGISRNAAVLLLADCLNKHRDNTLDRTQLQNLFGGWFIPPLHGADDSPLAETQSGTDVDGTPIAGLEPGTMQELPPGWDVKLSTPPSPGTDFGEFVRTQLLAFCASAGLPYEVLTGDLRDVSDRALKLVLNEFRRLIESDQWLYMIRRFCQQIREAWFDAAVLAGQLVVPGYTDIRDEVTAPQWVPQGWPWSHPVQDVDAETKAVRAGFKSRSDVILGQGNDPEETDMQQQRDNERADTLRIQHDSDGRRGKI